MSPNDERGFYDPTEDKRFGETYNDARARQSAQDAIERDRKQRQQAKQTTLPTGGNTYIPSAEYSENRDEKAFLGKVSIGIGWILVLVYAGLFVQYLPFYEMKIQGYFIEHVVLAGAVFFLVLGYFSEFIAIVLFLFAAGYLYSWGQTEEGFQFSAIPLFAYGISIAISFAGYLIRLFFGRKYS